MKYRTFNSMLNVQFIQTTQQHWKINFAIFEPIQCTFKVNNFLFLVGLCSTHSLFVYLTKNAGIPKTKTKKNRMKKCWQGDSVSTEKKLQHGCIVRCVCSVHISITVKHLVFSCLFFSSSCRCCWCCCCAVSYCSLLSHHLIEYCIRVHLKATLFFLAMWRRAS